MTDHDQKDLVRKKTPPQLKGYGESLRYISEVEKLSKEFFKSEAIYKGILNGMLHVVNIIDENLNIIWANKTAVEKWGDIIGKKCYTEYKGRNNECPDCTVRRVFKEGKTLQSERPSIYPDGTRGEFIVTSSPLEDSQGNVVAVIEMLTDITERKHLEQKIKDSEEKLQAILTGIGDRITIQDKDLDIIWVNQPTRAIWGDILGKKCYEVYRGLDAPCPDCTVEMVFDKEETMVSERSILRPDGQYAHILITSSPVRDAEGNIVAVVEVIKDIAKQKQLELQLKDYAENLEKVVEDRTKALRESEEKLHSILSAIGDRITIQNRELDIIWINQSSRDFYGDVIGRKCYEVYKGLAAPCPNCSVEKVFNEEKTVISEGMVIYPDGHPRNTLTTSSPVRDAEGNIVAVVEVAKDITERKQLEQQLEDYTENLEKIVEERTKALRESEERLNAILTGIGDCITIQSKDLDIIWMNQQEKAIYGDVIGQKCYEVYKGLDAPCPDCYIDVVFDEGKTVVSERANILPDGKVMQVLITSSPVRDAEGKIFAVVEVTKDITERKNLEMQLKDYAENLEKLVEDRTKALKISEEKLQAILTGIGDRISIESKDLDILWVNQPIKDIWGDVIGQKCYKAFKGLDEPCPDCNFEKVLHEGKIIASERTSILPDGRLSHTLTTSSPVRDAEGKIFAMVDVTKDITERKEAEEAVKRAEQRYRSLFEEAPVMYVITHNQDDRPIVVDCNELFSSTLGYTRAEILGRPLADFYTPESSSKLLDGGGYKQALEGHFTAQERELVTRDGRIIKTILQVVPVIDANDNVIGTRGMFVDITERKRAEEALRESEERYRGLYKSSIDGIASADVNGRFLDCNQAFADMLGYTKEELYQLTYWDITPPEWHNLTKEVTDGQTIHRGYSDEYEKEYIKKDGTHIFVSLRAWRTKDKEGNIITWAFIRDITERKRAEEALRESEEKYSTIVEQGNDGIAIVQDGVIKFVNPKMLELANSSLEDLLEMSFIDFVAPEHREFITELYKKRVSGEDVPHKYETAILLKSGEKIPFEVSANKIEYQGRPATLAILRDITERKKVDQMKTKFINTAAHELRTPLSALKAHVDLLEMKSKETTLPEEINRRIGIISRNADRLSILINNLLDYTRLEAGTIQPRLELISLESVAVQAIKEVLPLAQKHGHKIDLIIREPLPSIFVDKEMMHTIISNLISNAIKYTSDAGEINVTIIDKDENVQIMVKDTGIGISEEDFEKIFQPFHVAEIPASARFKSEFERTGLGLAITKEYVKMHGGSIWVESNIGKGSTFHVVIPINIQSRDSV